MFLGIVLVELAIRLKPKQDDKRAPDNSASHTLLTEFDSQLTVNSQSTHNQLTVNSQSTHSQLTVNSCVKRSFGAHNVTEDY